MTIRTDLLQYCAEPQVVHFHIGKLEASGKLSNKIISYEKSEPHLKHSLPLSFIVVIFLY